MHRALQIQEVLEIIIKFAVGGDVEVFRTSASLALTCKVFKSPALDVLWARQSSLVPLFKTISKDDQSRIDWGRFDEYAARVRSLCLDRNFQTGLADNEGILWLDVLSSRGRNCFPRLRQLDWQDNTWQDNTSYRHIRLFLGPSLVEFNWRLRGDFTTQDQLHNVVEQIRALRDLCPYIEIFYLHHGSRSVPQAFQSEGAATVAAAFTDLAMDLRYLRQFTAEECSLPLSRAAFGPVSLYPSLTNLTVNFASGFLDALPVAQARFPVLRHINIGVHTLAEFTSVLRMAQSRMRLACARLGECPTAAAVQATVETFRDHDTLAAVESLVIIYREKVPQDSPAYIPRAETFIPRASTFRPPLSLNLTDFCISLDGVTLDLDNDLLRDMAMAWPNLVWLEILGQPPYDDWAECQVTLDGLFPLFVNCKKLEYLSVYINGRVDPHASGIWRSHLFSRSNSNIQIHFGRSVIHAQNVRSAAEFLHDIFPALTEITVDWDNIHGIYGPEWAKVVSLLAEWVANTAGEDDDTADEVEGISDDAEITSDEDEDTSDEDGSTDEDETWS